MSRQARKTFADRLIGSMQEGLDELRSGRTLPEHQVAIPPPPPTLNPKALARLRRNHGMTQSAFAALLNVSEKTVESWEQGARKPSGAVLRLLQVIQNPEIISGRKDTSPVSRPSRKAKSRRDLAKIER